MDFHCALPLCPNFKLRSNHQLTIRLTIRLQLTGSSSGLHRLKGLLGLRFGLIPVPICTVLFQGVRVPVSKSRYRTIDSLLDDLNQNLQMPYGVRRLTTPMGRNKIETIDQLQHLGKCEREILKFEFLVFSNTFWSYSYLSRTFDQKSAFRRG